MQGCIQVYSGFMKFRDLFVDEFRPVLSTLPPAQSALWGELGDIPKNFILYGGTAIALRLGHRKSVDFDFFTFTPFDPGTLYGEIGILANAQIIQQQRNTLTCIVDRGDPVKVSFFALPKIIPLLPSEVASDNRLNVASLLDLAAMKALAVQQRAEAKDYIDIDAIIMAGIDLAKGLAAAKAIFGTSFNPQLTLKALAYFGEGDLASLSQVVKSRLSQAVKGVDLDRLPKLR